ncbi:MAG: hypothetical protein V4654_04535 [Bdellovibrionota bacterium]
MKKLVYGLTVILTLTGTSAFANEESFSLGDYFSSDTSCELNIAQLAIDNTILAWISPDCDQAGLNNDQSTYYTLQTKKSSYHTSTRDGIKKEITFELLSGSQILMTHTRKKLKTDDAPEKLLQYWRKVFVRKI